MQTIEQTTQMLENKVNEAKQLVCNKRNILNEVTERYKDKLTNVVKQYIGDQWLCSTLVDGYFGISFPVDTNEIGTPRYCTIDMYYNHLYDIAEKYNNSTFNITIEINVSARGSIDIFSTSESKEYYVGVGKIMGSAELQSKLKQTLDEYIAEVLPVNIEYTNLFERYREVVNELDVHNKRIEDEKLLNEQLNIINEYNGNGDVYVIVRNNSTDKSSPFTYRNKEVIWIDSEVYDYSSALSTVNKLNNHSFHPLYKHVPLHMLKRNVKYAM